MKQQTSPAIVLRRTNYGEADRIVTFLTPVGKVKAMVKGVRRSKSKLAGGIELFSESTITLMQTRGDLARIVSTRLDTHWDGIIGDLQKMMFGYEAMKLMDKIIEDEAEDEYYNLLKNVLESLNDQKISLEPLEVWYYARLLELQGHGLNLRTDIQGKKLVGDSLYTFSQENMCFSANSNGKYSSEQIKLLRLCILHPAKFLSQVKDVDQLSKTLRPLLKQLIEV